MRRSLFATSTMMMMMRWILSVTLLLLSNVRNTVQAQSVVDVIAAEPSMFLFYESLITYPNLVALLNGTTPGQFTIFVPTDDAISSSKVSAMFESFFWLGHLEVTVLNHVIPNRALQKLTLFDGTTEELPTAAAGETIQVTSFLAQLGEAGATITDADKLATNGIVHAIDRVLVPKQFDNSLAALEQQPEYAGSLTTVVDQVGGRAVLDEYVPEGRTYLGCASSDMTPDQLSEFLDSDLRETTRTNFVAYNILQNNFYTWDLPSAGNAAITLPQANCGHLIITTSASGKVCFNDACVIEEETTVVDGQQQQLRTYFASNGVGYILDKCLVCPGVAMMLEYSGSDYADFGTDDISALFQATDWDLRDLTQTVTRGGGPITLFATTQKQWGTLSMQDNLKLRTNPAWKPHLQDVLLSMMVPGTYMGADLKRYYDEEGGDYQLKTLNGGSLTISYDAISDYLLIDGKPIFVANMMAVDGILHLTEHVPTPESLTANLYQVGQDGKKLNAFMNLIDQPEALDLRNMLELVEPLTVLYVLDNVWAGVLINSANITGDIMENHILPDIYSCETLMDLRGTTIMSVNGANWTVDMDDDTGLPCFVPAIDPLGLKACIAECDVVARNGIGHKMSMLLGQPGVVLPQAPSSAPSPAPVESDPNAPSAAPSRAVGAFDLPGCLDDLAAADVDGDGAIRRHEFYNFVAAYGLRKCYEIGNALLPEQIDLFYKFACQCKDQDGADEECCEGTAAFLDLVGTVIPDQGTYKTGLCEALERQLLDEDCGGGDDQPTPAPTRFADRKPALGDDGSGNGDSDGSSATRAGVTTMVATATVGLLAAFLWR